MHGTMRTSACLAVVAVLLVSGTGTGTADVVINEIHYDAEDNTSREEFIASQVRGEQPSCDGAVLRRLHHALDELVRSVPALLAVGSR